MIHEMRLKKHIYNLFTKFTKILLDLCYGTIYNIVTCGDSTKREWRNECLSRFQI